ncbi:unnamed protein product [Ranitomeya imitator]|uniref:Helix-turn-helix domain-containing protein n=1 Tax=Ranitomeya imitator TaxID=111125 RepID=A0ABN9LPW3_9NEOB|nr:unnamed protein product [Ranitomeya imitator]
MGVEAHSCSPKKVKAIDVESGRSWARKDPTKNESAHLRTSPLKEKKARSPDKTGSTAEVDEIMSHVKIPGEFLHTPAEEIRSRDWERELRKKTSLELHYVTLAEYHKVKRIPRGLRVSLRPTLFQDKSDYCVKFEGILNKCSMDIIILTIEYLQREITEVDKQIEGIQQQLSSTLASDKFDTLKQKIDKSIDEFKNVLQERKRSKFLRDTEDYHRNTVYRWRDINTQKDRRQFRRDNNFYTTSSSSDNESGSRTTLPFLEQRRGRSSRNRRGGAPDHANDISRVRTRSQSKCALINQGLLSIKRNCTPIEKRALEDLKSNKSITIKPADKGGAVVVMDTSFYISMVRQHLDDVNTYMPVDRDPTREITQEIKQIVDSFKEQNVIDSKLAEYLINKHPVVPVFYALPKIHKHQTLPPGRPIVASTDSLLAPLAKTVEKILTPLLGNIVSFIKDTPDFLDGLNSLGTLPKGCFLVTMDVNSLYTNIEQNRGLEAVNCFLNTYTDFTSIQTNFCLTLLRLILTKNFFLFSDQFFIQRVGTAMGSNMAPPYANIFMAFFEENCVYTHTLFQRHSLYWKRFIDDVFFIWGGDEVSLTQFFQDMNTQIPNLTFTISKSQQSVNFLDTLVTIKDNGLLDIDLYTKPLDRNNLLLFSSCHPIHVKQSLPKSQVQRIQHIVTNPGLKLQRSLEMTNKFSDRGYPSSVLQKALQDTPRRVESSKRVAFVTTYHPYTNFFKKCILEH